MKNIPWDQRLARILVRPLVNSPVTPNAISITTLLGALAGAGLLAVGDPVLANLGAGVFVFSRFLDHFDGELARQQGTSSRLGYYLDYIAGGVGYGALFICMGIGFRDGVIGPWAIALGAAASSAAVIGMFLNLGIDKETANEMGAENDSVGYPGFAGFELEDGIYLLAPVTWLGFLEPFFIAACIGAVIYTLWTLRCMLVLRRKNKGA